MGAFVETDVEGLSVLQMMAFFAHELSVMVPGTAANADCQRLAENICLTDHTVEYNTLPTDEFLSLVNITIPLTVNRISATRVGVYPYPLKIAPARKELLGWLLKKVIGGVGIMTLLYRTLAIQFKYNQFDTFSLDEKHWTSQNLALLRARMIKCGYKLQMSRSVTEAAMVNFQVICVPDVPQTERETAFFETLKRPPWYAQLRGLMTAPHDFHLLVTWIESHYRSYPMYHNIPYPSHGVWKNASLRADMLAKFARDVLRGQFTVTAGETHFVIAPNPASAPLRPVAAKLQAWQPAYPDHAPHIPSARAFVRQFVLDEMDRPRKARDHMVCSLPLRVFREQIAPKPALLDDGTEYPWLYDLIKAAVDANMCDLDSIQSMNVTYQPHNVTARFDISFASETNTN